MVPPFEAPSPESNAKERNDELLSNLSRDLDSEADGEITDEEMEVLTPEQAEAERRKMDLEALKRKSGMN